MGQGETSLLREQNIWEFPLLLSERTLYLQIVFLIGADTVRILSH